MNDQPTATLVGDLVDSPLKKPPTRAQRIEAWRAEHRDAYTKACEYERCTCTPSKAEALLMAQWDNPPID